MTGTAADHDSSVLDDELLDQLDATLRRIRRALVKPAHTEVPVPCLGRPLELAKLFVCDALADLDADDASVGVNDVAAAMQLEHSTVSRVLGELEIDELVRREVDPSDRRRTVVSLSERGRAVLADSHELRRALTRTVLADWDSAEVGSLTRLLERLAASIVERGEELTAQLRSFASESGSER
ncbi:MAG TPA: MarR family transcriptional regulator [Candidatus Nanopelagicales bacterium]|nr:MarR family transcriptional regulator [Candidatus Nanopelagicales bacterium]